MNGYRKETINTIVLLVTVFLAIQLESWFPNITNRPLFIAISLLTAKGFYELVVKLIFFLISHTSFFMKIYWGKIYLNGYWSYEYTREGKKYFGIWQITQDLTSTYIVGSGLNEDYSVRTIVRSVSPLLKEQGVYFVLNVRSELSSETGFIANVYSKTTLILDEPNKWWVATNAMRATTEIYGGNSNAHIHSNVVFKKHKRIKSHEELISKLSQKTDLPKTTKS